MLRRKEKIKLDTNEEEKLYKSTSNYVKYS